MTAGVQSQRRPPRQDHGATAAAAAAASVPAGSMAWILETRQAFKEVLSNYFFFAYFENTY